MGLNQEDYKRDHEEDDCHYNGAVEENFIKTALGKINIARTAEDSG